jgi:hypothetical protein
MVRKSMTNISLYVGEDKSRKSMTLIDHSIENNLVIFVMKSDDLSIVKMEAMKLKSPLLTGDDAFLKEILASIEGAWVGESNLPLRELDLQLVCINKALAIFDIAKIYDGEPIKGLVPTVYMADELDGRVRIGWNYRDQLLPPGTKVHYDHGVGVGRNADATLLWAPAMTTKNMKELFSSERARVVTGIAQLNDGRVSYGLFSPMSNGGVKVNLRSINDNVPLDDIALLVLVPTEDLLVTNDIDCQPKEGELIFAFDSEKSRQQYSGPYRTCGNYDASGGSNKRFARYGGPMLSGESWSSFAAWVALDDVERQAIGSDFYSYANDMKIAIEPEHELSIPDIQLSDDLDINQNISLQQLGRGR